MNNEQLVARIRAGEDEADNMLQLWEHNKGFIAKMAQKYSAVAEMDDLRQEGYIGLCEAVRHYESDRGTKFISYAAFWIKLAMRRYAANCRAIRLPENAQNEVSEYKKIVNEYRKNYGIEPTERELKAFLGVDAQKLESIRKNAQIGQIRSLNEPMGEGGDSELGDSIPSNKDIEADTIHRLDFENMKRELWLAVDNLPREQAAILRMRFEEEKTFRASGEDMGLSVEAVRQIQNKAIRALRLPGRSRKFRGYYEEYLEAFCYRHVGLESFKSSWTSEVEREVLGS